MTTSKKQEIFLKYFLIVFSFIAFVGCDNRIRIESNSSEEQTIEIKKGERFYINLPEDHSTGYIWFLNQDYNKFGKIDYVAAVFHSTNKGNIDYSFETKNDAYAEMHFYLVKYRDTLEHKKFKVRVN